MLGENCFKAKKVPLEQFSETASGNLAKVIVQITNAHFTKFYSIVQS